MLDCRQDTIFVVLLTRASPHMLDTIWVKQVYLRLIIPQDMVLVIHALGQVVFSKMFAGFFVSQLQKRLPSGTTAMQRLVAVCGVWSEHWQADLPLLQPLKQCWQHSCVCFLKPASESWRTAQGLNFFIDPCEPVPSETRLGKVYDPGHCTVTRFQGVTELLIASAIFVESNNSNSQILREFFAMRCHVESTKFNCSKTRYTNLYGPVKQTKTWTWWIGHVALHG